MWKGLLHPALITVLLTIQLVTSKRGCPNQCSCWHISVQCENFTQTTHQNIPYNARYLIIINLKNSLQPCSVANTNITYVLIRQSDLEKKSLGWLFNCYPSVRALRLINSNLPVLRNTTFATTERPKSMGVLGIEFSNLKAVHSGAFSLFDKLTRLVLIGNPLKITEDGLLSGLGDLVTLEIDFNFRLVNRVPENIFKHSPKLSKLIIGVEDLGHLSKMKIPFDLPQLTSLTVSGKIISIEDDTFCGLSSLDTLTLQKLEIKDLPMDFIICLPSLSTITVDNSTLMRLINPRQRLTTGATSLKIILSNNKILSFPSALSRLYPTVKSLDLSGNPLILRTGDLILPDYECNFEHLSFKNCGIHNIPTDYFKNCIHLKTLSFESNRLMFVQKILPPNQQLLVYLHDNPLYCGCQHTGLDLLILNEPTTTSGTFFQCASPANMMGKGITQKNTTTWRSFMAKYSTLPKCKIPDIQHFIVTSQDLSVIECQATGDPSPTIIIKEPSGNEHIYLPNPPIKQNLRRLVGSAPGIYYCSANNGEGKVMKELRFKAVPMESTSGMFVTEETPDSTPTPDSNGNNVLLYILPPVVVGIVLVFVVVAAAVWIGKRVQNRPNSSMRGKGTSEDSSQSNHDINLAAGGTSKSDYEYDYIHPIN